MNSELAGQLIGLLFLSRDVAHRAHLRANGVGAYAAHVALGDFYGVVIGHADSITEALQGEYGVLLDIPFLEDDSDGDVFLSIETTLRRHKSWIDQNRYNAVPRELTSVQNIIDEVIASYQSVLYKLKFLK